MDAAGQVSALSATLGRVSFPIEHGPVCVRHAGSLLRLSAGLADRLRRPGPFSGLDAASVTIEACTSRMPSPWLAEAPDALEELVVPVLRGLEGLPAWAADAVASQREPLLQLVLAASARPGSLVKIRSLPGGAIGLPPLVSAVANSLEQVLSAITPGVASAKVEAETTPGPEEPLDRAMVAEAKACHQRAEDGARQAGRDSTAWHEGDCAAKAFQGSSDTDIARALVDARRILRPADDKAWEATRKRISRARKELVRKDRAWVVVKRKRGSATAAQIADARGQAGMSLERRPAENDTRVRWCRNCGISPEDAGQGFCMACMGRLTFDDRESILGGSARPLSARLSKDALERERAGTLQRIAQAAEEQRREADSDKAGR